MADKLRTTYPVKIEFTGGEQPTASKLTAISSQAKSGLRIIEKAIGDLWGTGGDGNVKGLQIPTLGRVVGENKYLNPVLYELASGSAEFYYIERLNSSLTDGNTTGYLTFKPTELASIVLADITSEISSDQRRAEEKLVLAAGDYWVDLETGRFRFHTPIALGTDLFIGYKVDPSNWEEAGSVPGIIPDPRSTTTYVTVTSSGADYQIVLPYREPLSGITEKHPERCLYGSGDLDLNTQEYALVINGGHPAFESETTQRLWSNSSASAFYRYRIPALETVAAEDYLPEGTVMLAYVSTGGDYEVIEGLRFIKVDNFTVKIEDTAGQLLAKQNYITAQEAIASYRLLTAGPSVTKTIFNLNKAFANHTHDNSHGEKAIEHSSITGLSATLNSHDKPWTKSRYEADDHIQYIHRDGANNGNENRDLNKNAMFGDLIFAQTTSDNINSEILIGELGSYDTNRIYFGNNSSGSPSIFGGPHKHTGPSGSSTATLKLREDLLIEASNVTIQSLNVVVKDKNITLAYSDSVDGGAYLNDDQVEGGGIILKSSDADRTFKFFKFKDTTTTDNTDYYSWVSSNDLTATSGRLWSETSFNTFNQGWSYGTQSQGTDEQLYTRSGFTSFHIAPLKKAYDLLDLEDSWPNYETKAITNAGNASIYSKANSIVCSGLILYDANTSGWYRTDSNVGNAGGNVTDLYPSNLQQEKGSILNPTTGPSSVQDSNGFIWNAMAESQNTDVGPHIAAGYAFVKDQNVNGWNIRSARVYWGQSDQDPYSKPVSVGTGGGVISNHSATCVVSLKKAIAYPGCRILVHAHGMDPNVKIVADFITNDEDVPSDWRSVLTTKIAIRVFKEKTFERYTDAAHKNSASGDGWALDFSTGWAMYNSNPATKWSAEYRFPGIHPDGNSVSDFNPHWHTYFTKGLVSVLSQQTISLQIFGEPGYDSILLNQWINLGGGTLADLLGLLNSESNSSFNEEVANGVENNIENPQVNIDLNQIVSYADTITTGPDPLTAMQTQVTTLQNQLIQVGALGELATAQADGFSETGTLQDLLDDGNYTTTYTAMAASSSSFSGFAVSSNMDFGTLNGILNGFTF